MRYRIYLHTGNSRPDIQGGHSMNVVYDLRGVWECKPWKLEDFSFLRLKNMVTA